MALALDTTIATPLGFRRVAQLEVGDHVFDGTGSPTRVRARSRVWSGADTYRVKLHPKAPSGIVCDGDQVWRVLVSGRGVAISVATGELEMACCDDVAIFLAGERREATPQAKWLTWRHEDRIWVERHGVGDVRSLQVTGSVSSFCVGSGNLPTQNRTVPWPFRA